MTNQPVRIRGIDTDNYDGIIAPARLQRLHDERGVLFNIIGLEARMPFAKAQQLAGLSVGIDNPFCYKFVYWKADDIDRLKEAATFGKTIAIDVEVETNWPGIGPAVQRLHEAKDALNELGAYWGMYSSPYYWQKLTGNTQDFAGDKCWSATYPFGNGVVPPIDYLPDFTPPMAFGGCKLEIIQYADACYFDDEYPQGRFDLNAYQYPVAAPPPLRVWIYGDQFAGLEKIGQNQQGIWNNNVLTDILGDEAGLFPGRHLHNEGGVFVEVLP